VIEVSEVVTVRIALSSGLIVELDGFHTEKEQQLLDTQRDEAVKDTRWETKRITHFIIFHI
jgi:very-short-patch-repair endonuclease